MDEDVVTAVRVFGHRPRRPEPEAPRPPLTAGPGAPVVGPTWPWPAPGPVEDVYHDLHALQVEVAQLRRQNRSLTIENQHLRGLVERRRGHRG